MGYEQVRRRTVIPDAILAQGTIFAATPVAAAQIVKAK
jgi:hypothetical protein